jgi:hypothetical protein
MSFRPQFSLRTLLLVTALIAVGAKLWHGPYHVVETIDGVEHEYDYYRAWGWERVKHGVEIQRAQVNFDEYDMPEIAIRFFREGQDSMNLVELAGRDPAHFLANEKQHQGMYKVDFAEGVLNANQKQQMESAVARETERLKQAGYQPEVLLRHYLDEMPVSNK